MTVKRGKLNPAVAGAALINFKSAIIRFYLKEEKTNLYKLE